MFAFLVLFSFLGKALAIAQATLPQSLPVHREMPPLEFAAHPPIVLDKDKSIIEEPAGAQTNWSLYNLARMSLNGSLSSTNHSHLWQLPPVPEFKFSFDNLLGGLIYDFKKTNDMRVEFGGPGLGEWDLNEVDVKYDVPFCLLILLNRKF